MTKPIAEMSLEELQDFALEKVQELEALNTAKDTLQDDYNQLLEDNKALQVRNNRLFMQVESGVPAEQPTAEPPQTCEEFATTIKGVIKH